ncbi:MAG: histidine--tRNA ligase [Candidatus Omnitrophica bacterium]|nr:histidine--tRNA ligase [Candidatus Omnitrophota bacterium]
MFKKVAGTKDILPLEIPQWQETENISRSIFSVYNYREIRPPVMEEAALFNRSLGESAEIVQKQMFLIKNKDETYALRPEATASIVRAYIENSLDKASALQKLYYIGPMFRLERPQKGRLRQFHHIGCEVIGSGDAGVDVEVISLADTILKACAIEGYQIKINSLGCLDDKKGLARILRESIKGQLNDFCQECRQRFDRNVLRVLDCKNESCRKIIAKLNISDRHLCPDCKEHFSLVKQGLDDLKVSYEVLPYLVRGLDYYTRTVFEITHRELGAQDALAAGGRYDKLVSELGGPDVGAIGFAFGVERLLLISGPKNNPDKNKDLVYVIALGQEAKREAGKILAQLRRENIASDTDYAGKSLKGAMRQANDSQAKCVLIIGEEELKKGTITLKDMISGQQKEIRQDELIRALKC